MYTSLFSILLAPVFSIEKDMSQELESQLDAALTGCEPAIDWFVVGRDYHVGPRYAHVNGQEPTIED